MSQITKLSLAVFFMTLIVFTVGCSSDEPPAASEADGTEAPAMPPPEQPGTPAPESGDQSALPTEGDPAGEPQPPGTATAPSPADQAKAAKIEANLVSLSVEDRALALKQQICPVSGGPLGAMGTPKKVTVAGHEVFVCCEGCEKPLLNDPAKHLAKIGLTPTDTVPIQ